jgi:hypothetical protein
MGIRIIYLYVILISRMEKEILVLKIADKGSDHREISKEVFII